MSIWDDLILAAPTKEQCEDDTLKLLIHLAAEGHKASLNKLQLVKHQVTFLGNVISANGKSISSNRIQAIHQVTRPRTKRG